MTVIKGDLEEDEYEDEDNADEPLNDVDDDVYELGSMLLFLIELEMGGLFSLTRELSSASSMSKSMNASELSALFKSSFSSLQLHSIFVVDKLKHNDCFELLLTKLFACGDSSKSSCCCCCCCCS